MISVMIVEDEFLARQDLKNLVKWEKHGFHIVAEASNGKEGIEFFKRCSPELVITDVKMPFMDGLDMAKEILQQDRNVKFILLTAYDDFEYAREAIKLGITSYILKHEIDSESLLQELLKIKNLMYEDQSYKQFTINSILSKIVKEQHSDTEVQLLVDKYRLPIKKGSTVMLLTAFDEDDGVNDELRSNKEVLDAIKKTVNKYASGIAFNTEKDRYLVFVTLNNINSKAKSSEIIHRLCLDMQSEIEKTINKTISIVIGDILEDFSDMYRYYRKVVNSIRYKFFTKGSAILYPEEDNTVSAEQLAEYNQLVIQFKDKITNSEFDTAKKILNTLFKDLLVKAKNIKLFQDCFSTILEILHESIIKTDSEQLNNYKKINFMYEQSSKLDNIYQVYDWIINIINTLEICENSNYSHSVRKAIKYIHKNYNKDISLKELAGVMGVSFIYASQLFKKEIGKPFKVYLVNYRMQKAKELLESGNYRIYEVSEMVGYQTVQYFCQTFKRITGKNPGEFIK